MSSIHIISASAGTGKTDRLAAYLEEAVATGEARPEAVVAVTFTKKAAAELAERARLRLLERGHAEDAHRLLAARIGTIDAVCGALTSEFAYELGLSPSSAVLDEAAAERALGRALAGAVSPDEAQELSRISDRIDHLAWQVEVRRIVDAARSNAIEAAALADCARRSSEELLALVRARTGPGDRGHDGERDADLRRAIALAFSIAARALDEYQAQKQQRRLLDCTDQEALALAALRMEDVRERLRDAVDLVLVDEFQDASPLELAVFLGLARLAPAVWAGDHKQAIFGFRGADLALMDAAIEDFASPTHAPELVGETVAAVGGEPELLTRSLRAHPDLVDVTNRIFGEAFSRRGMPAACVHLEPTSASEPTGFPSCLEYWPIEIEEHRPASDSAQAVAAGVANFLSSADTRVRDGVTGAARPPIAADVAVLCRTNARCQRVASALEAQGLRASAARAGLFATVEGRVARAALKLWVDAADALAAAELARVLAYADRPDDWLARILDRPGARAFDEEPCLKALSEARAQARFAGPVEALDAAVEAIRLADLCRGWGDAELRLANLDAIRAHAVAYARRSAADGRPATVAGLLAAWEELAREPAGDTQAAPAGGDAVTVTTWHRAKGLAWPVVVLFDLERVREALPSGVKVETDRGRFSAADPLAGRWIRFWPSPRHPLRGGAAFGDAAADGEAVESARERATRELLRLAYVGWSCALDRVALAAVPGRLTGGILSALTDAGGAPLIAEPARGGDGRWPPIARVTWAGRAVELRVRPATPPAPGPRVSVRGRAYPKRPRRTHPPAFAAPSDLGPGGDGAAAAATGAPIRIGDRLPIAGVLDMARLGSALRGFLAADTDSLDRRGRLVLAARQLSQWRVGGALRPEHLVGASDALCGWIARSLAGATWYRAWPLLCRLPNGTVIRGAPDLVLRRGDDVYIVGHKTFPGTEGQALARARRHAPELAACATALAEKGAPPPRAFIHLPLLGLIVPLRG